MNGPVLVHDTNVDEDRLGHHGHLDKQFRVKARTLSVLSLLTVVLVTCGGFFKSQQSIVTTNATILSGIRFQVGGDVVGGRGGADSSQSLNSHFNISLRGLGRNRSTLNGFNVPLLVSSTSDPSDTTDTTRTNRTSKSSLSPIPRSNNHSLLFWRHDNGINIDDEIDAFNDTIGGMMTTHTYNIQNTTYTVRRPNITHVLRNVNAKRQADELGPVMDFAIMGFGKCGTTTMSSNLAASVAPMLSGDTCTPIKQHIWYTNMKWPHDQKKDPNNTKPLKGVKCPRGLEGYGDVKRYSDSLPKTKFIIGIRHPVLWFQSFFNMQTANWGKKRDPYRFHYPRCTHGNCRNRCKRNDLFCTARSNFLIPISRLGKTPMNMNMSTTTTTTEELQFLPEWLVKKYRKRKPARIANHVFLFETNQMSTKLFGDTMVDEFWSDVANFLDYPWEISHNIYSKARKELNPKHLLNICEPKYDKLRSVMMPAAYDMSRWICDYFIQAPDVTVSNQTQFCSIVQDYRNDPCDRLIRIEANGTYVLNPNLTNL